MTSITLGNEYAAVRLTLDHSGRGPRVHCWSIRDNRDIFLDPIALSLLCHMDLDTFKLLADIAKDDVAVKERQERLRGSIGGGTLGPLGGTDGGVRDQEIVMDETQSATEEGPR